MKQKHIGRARSIQLTRRIKPVRTARLVKRTSLLQSIKPTKLAQPAQPTKPTRRNKPTKLAQPTKLTRQTKLTRRTKLTRLRGGSSPVAAISTAGPHASSITSNTSRTPSIARPQYDRWEPGQTPQIKTVVCNNQLILSQQMYYYRLGYIQRIADLVNIKNRHKMANQEITDLNNIVVGMDKRYNDAILEPTYVPVSSHMTKMPPKSASPAMLNRTYREAYF